MSTLTAGGFRRVHRSLQFLAAALAAALLLWAPPAGAQTDSGLSPEQEKTARGIEGKLIAPCCYTATVSTHDSEAADMIKADIRTMLARGSSDDEILENYVERYGEQILAAPMPKGFNLTAYLFPSIAVVVAGVIMTLVALRWRRREDRVPEGVPAAVADPKLAQWEERLREEISGFDR